MGEKKSQRNICIFLTTFYSVATFFWFLPLVISAFYVVAVNFGPCARAILDVFQWYWVVFSGVLGCFRVVWGILDLKT